MPKAPSGDARQARRHNPLSEEYMPSNPLKQKAPKKRKSPANGEAEDHYVDSKASQRILKIGQDLADEEEAENEALRPKAPNPAFDFESRFPREVESDDEGLPTAEDDEAWGDEEDEEVEEIEVDPNDLAMFNRFNPEFDPSTLLGSTPAEEEGETTNLADLILAKIAAQEESQDQRQILGGGRPEDAIELPAKVVEVYTQYALRILYTNAHAAQSLTMHPESVLFFHVTSLANCPNHSRFFPLSHNGTSSSPLLALTPGPQTQHTKPQNSSPHHDQLLPKLSCTTYSSRESEKTSTIPRNSMYTSTKH